MSRAAGRKNLPRAPQADPGPDSPEGREIGESRLNDPAGSPIPGLTGNIVNYETVRQKVPVGESFDEYRGMMAHGVPNDSATTEERAQMERDGSLAQHQPFRPPKLAKASSAPAPVPVYITEPAGGSRPLTTLATAKLTIPGNTNGTSVRICARDETRLTMYAMVETAAGAAGAAPTGIRIDHELSVVETGEGALLRAGMASYQELKGCQDELFAMSNDSSACTLSIIYIYGVAAAG